MLKVPDEARHIELSNGDHTVIVVPLKWRNLNGKCFVQRTMAYCKTCGWDTPTLFSKMAAETAGRRHLGLIPVE